MKDTTTIKTLPGTLSPMKRPEYDADTERLRSTSLKDLVIPEQGPRAYYLNHIDPIGDVEEESDDNHALQPKVNEFVQGCLLHEFVLEGKENWHVTKNRRGSKAWEADALANSGKWAVTAKIDAEIRAWAAGILRNKEATRVCRQRRYEEQVILWSLEVTFADDQGEMVTMTVPCKAAIDLFPYGEHRRYCIKTWSGQGYWDRVVFDLGYHVSAAWYEWGVHSLPAYKDKPEGFSNIVVTKKRPYWCYVRPLSDAALTYGRRECELAVERYCECVRRQELYELDGRPAIDAWPDHKEAKQGIPVAPSDFYKVAYGEKHAEPVPTSNEPCWEDPAYV